MELIEAERQDDLAFKRLCLSIDLMICEAKQALDQSTKTGVKVLSSFDMCKGLLIFFLVTEGTWMDASAPFCIFPFFVLRCLCRHHPWTCKRDILKSTP